MTMEKKTGIDPEEYAKKFPVVKYDVQPNANGNTYDENELEKMVQQWHSQQSQAVYREHPGIEKVTKDMATQMAKNLEQSMYESVMNGPGLQPGAVQFPTAHPLQSKDLRDMMSAISGEPATIHRDPMTVKQVMELMSPNDLIDNALVKLGREVTNQSRKAIRDFMIRVTKSDVFDPSQPGPPGKESEFTKPLFEELLDIEGVEKAEVMLDDYPEMVSIIVRLNMSDFPDDLVDVNMDKIDYAIQANKPQRLEKLEVLFHNKVVY